MTYEEIKSKYAAAVKAYHGRVAVARARLQLKEASLQVWKDNRESLRGNEISAERAKLWNSYSTRIRQLQKEIDAAKDELAKAQLNENTIIF